MLVFLLEGESADGGFEVLLDFLDESFICPELLLLSDTLFDAPEALPLLLDELCCVCATGSTCGLDAVSLYLLPAVLPTIFASPLTIVPACCRLMGLVVVVVVVDNGSLERSGERGWLDPVDSFSSVSKRYHGVVPDDSSS